MAARFDLNVAKFIDVLSSYSCSPTRISLAACISSVGKSLRALGDVVVSLTEMPCDDVRINSPLVCQPALCSSNIATLSGPLEDPQVGIGCPLTTAFHALDKVDSGRKPLYFLAAFHACGQPYCDGNTRVFDKALMHRVLDCPRASSGLRTNW